MTRWEILREHFSENPTNEVLSEIEQDLTNNGQDLGDLSDLLETPNPNTNTNSLHDLSNSVQDSRKYLFEKLKAFRHEYLTKTLGIEVTEGIDPGEIDFEKTVYEFSQDPFDVRFFQVNPSDQPENETYHFTITTEMPFSEWRKMEFSYPRVGIKKGTGQETLYVQGKDMRFPEGYRPIIDLNLRNSNFYNVLQKLVQDFAETEVQRTKYPFGLNFDHSSNSRFYKGLEQNEKRIQKLLSKRINLMKKGILKEAKFIFQGPSDDNVKAFLEGQSTEGFGYGFRLTTEPFNNGDCYAKLVFEGNFRVFERSKFDERMGNYLETFDHLHGLFEKAISHEDHNKEKGLFARLYRR